METVKQDQADAPDTPDPPVLELVPGPALVWLCDCGKMGIIPDQRALHAWASGRRIGIKRQHCARDIALVHPEPPLVVTPEQVRKAQGHALPQDLMV